MKIIVALLLFIVAQLCLASPDTNAIATGDWSASVSGLRARLLVSATADGASRRGIVHLELQNVSTNHETLAFSSDFLLECELLDTSGKPPPPATWFSSGPVSPPAVLMIPYDSTIKVRIDDVNKWAVGDVGLYLSLGSKCWLIADKAHTDFFLSGTVKFPPAQPPTGKLGAWRGVLKLPNVKIAAQSRKP